MKERVFYIPLHGLLGYIGTAASEGMEIFSEIR